MNRLVRDSVPDNPAKLLGASGKPSAPGPKALGTQLGSWAWGPCGAAPRRGYSNWSSNLRDITSEPRISTPHYVRRGFPSDNPFATACIRHSERSEESL